MTFSPKEVYVLTTLAQHSNDKASQNALLGKLEGDARVVGRLIIGENVSANAAFKQYANSVRAWAGQLKK